MSNLTSPIRYMGNKRKLIKKGLTGLFPSDTECFYDLFGGSGVVSMNVKVENIVLNELDSHVYSLYDMFKTEEPTAIIAHAESRIEEFGLPKINTDKRKVGEAVRNKYKDRYLEFREYYNETKDVKDLYVLMNYAMSQTMRFNNSGGFNMPFGNNRFIPDKHGCEIINFHKFLQRTTILNLDYKDVDIKKSDKTFVYLDPPYLGSVATYNEKGGWTHKDNLNLMSYLDKLDTLGVKWGMSNILKNRNMEDSILVSWIKSNGYNTHYFGEFDYYSFGKGKSDSVEVFVCNY